MSRDHTLKVRIDDDEKVALDKAADKLKEPVSMIVRRAIRQYLDKIGTQS